MYLRYMYLDRNHQSFVNKYSSIYLYKTVLVSKMYEFTRNMYILCIRRNKNK